MLDIASCPVSILELCIRLYRQGKHAGFRHGNTRGALRVFRSQGTQLSPFSGLKQANSPHRPMGACGPRG